MTARAFGTVQGSVVKLDKPGQLEGKRVRIVLEEIDAAEDVVLSNEQQAKLWSHWVARGPQGPVDDEGETDFP